MPKQIPKGKEVFYTYTVLGYKKKLMAIAEEKGLTLTDYTNLLFEKDIENYETRKSRKLR